MFRVILFVALLSFCSTSILISQQSFDNDYQPVKSSGPLPDDFLFRTKDKIKADSKTTDAGPKTTYDYKVIINYAIDKELRSGNILINDELSNYVNRVADELLKDNKELRNKLKIYITKIPETNAYTMDKGYIFVDIGLLSQLKNEAQLAYVLSHEISHYTQKHTYSTFEELKKLRKNFYKKKGFQDRIIKFYKFTRANETDADTMGYKLFTRTAYSPKEINTTFEMLQFSYLPFELIKFDSTYFNDEYYKIPSKYFLPEVLAINSNDDDNDTRNTHPNIHKRKKTIDSLMAKSTQKDGKKFLVSEKDFLRVRDIARFEGCRLDLVERNYLSAMMSAYILLKKYPDNLFLHKVISKSLFAMTLYKSGELKYDEDSYRKGPIPDFTQTEGYAQQLNFFLDKLPPAECAVLALKYNIDCSNKYGNESMFTSFSDSLMKMLVTKYSITINDFSEGTPSTDYYKNAFIKELKQNPELKVKLQKISEGSKPKEIKSDLKVYNPNAGKEKKDKKPKEVLPVEAKLNIQKILVLDPYYIKIDTRLSEIYSYGVSDDKAGSFAKSIVTIGADFKIDCPLLEPEGFSSTTIDDYNNFSVLQDWFNERLDGGEDQCNYVFCTDDINKVEEKYGTKYCLWSGVIAYTEGNKERLIGLPTNVTYYFALLVDLSTGKVIEKKVKEMEKSDSFGRVDDLVKDTFREIKLK